MGYTHYWEFKKGKNVGTAWTLEKRYQLAIRDCARVVRRYYQENGGIAGYTAHTAIGAYGGIEFNGKGDEGHETFSLREHYSQNLESGGFSFCKTAEKPYDTLVVACLAILKHRLGDAISVSSDGDAIDWQKGVAYAKKITRLAIKNPIPKREKLAG